MKGKILICSLLGLLSVVSCRAERQERQRSILLLMKTQDNPFFQEIQRGVNDAWSKIPGHGQLHVRAGSKEGDVTTQRHVLREFFDQYVKGQTNPELRGVLITPSGSSIELVSQLKALRDAGIPVVIIDTKIDEAALKAAGTTYDAFVGSDNQQGGALAARIIASKIPSGGQILVLNGIDGQETATARRQGFHEQIKKIAEDKKIKYSLQERTCNWRRSEARATLSAFLGAGRRFDGIFAANDQMALGAIEAIRQNPNIKRPTVIVGFDAIEDARKAVKEKLLTATLAQDPYNMGVKAVEALTQIWDGKQVTLNQIIPVQEILE